MLTAQVNEQDIREAIEKDAAMFLRQTFLEQANRLFADKLPSSFFRQAAENPRTLADSCAMWARGKLRERFAPLVESLPKDWTGCFQRIEAMANVEIERFAAEQAEQLFQATVDHFGLRGQ